MSFDNLSFENWSIDNLIADLNIFDDIDFSILYSWLPGDIASAISMCLTCLAMLAVFGIIKRILSAIPFV